MQRRQAAGSTPPFCGSAEQFTCSSTALPRSRRHPPGEVRGQVGAVHRVNQREATRRACRALFRCSVPMRCHATGDAGQRILLLERLLHPVLAHVAEPGRERRRAPRRRGCVLVTATMRDRMAAPRPGLAAVDRLADGRQPVNQVMGCHNL